MAVPRRDVGWFLGQSALFLAVLASPLIDGRRPAAATRVLGLGLLSGGVGLAVAGYRELGERHSPWTTPTEGAGLVTTGIYGRIRHPVYAGWVLGSLGLEVLAGSRLGVSVVGGLMVFYDLRTRGEDRLLAERYPGAADYRVAVKRFIPGVY